MPGQVFSIVLASLLLLLGCDPHDASAPTLADAGTTQPPDDPPPPPDDPPPPPDDPPPPPDDPPPPPDDPPPPPDDPPPTGELPFLRGDVDGNGILDRRDHRALVRCLTGHGPCSPCEDARDANDDGILDFKDIASLNRALNTRFDPPPPYPLAGEDPTPDGLGCPIAEMLPDLAVEDIRVIPHASQTFPEEGESVTLAARVANLGWLPTTNVRVKFYLNDPTTHGRFAVIGETVVSPPDFIGPNGTRRVTLALPAGLTFPASIKVYADEDDPIDLIAETDEKNNRRVEEAHVRMPDLAFTDAGLGIQRSTLSNVNDPVQLFLYADPNDTVTLSVDVTNHGDADAGSFTVRFVLVEPPQIIPVPTPVGGIGTIGPPSSGSPPAAGAITPTTTNFDQVVGPLAIGASTTVSQVLSLDQVGPHVFRVIIDPSGGSSSVRESDEQNNRLARSADVLDPPVLSVEDVTVLNTGALDSVDQPQSFVAGDDVSIWGTVANYDSTAASPVTMSIVHTPPRAAGSSQTLTPGRGLTLNPEQWFRDSRDIRSVGAGLHTVRVDASYSRNGPTFQASGEFCVRPALPDLHITLLRLDVLCPRPDTDDDIPVDVQVKNIGEAASGQFDVELYSTQNANWSDLSQLTHIDTRQVGSLAAGNHHDLQFTWPGLHASGDHTLVVVADPNVSAPANCPATVSGSLWDLDPGNNLWATRVFVNPAAPDLVVETAGASPSNPIEDNEITVHARAINTGGTDATVPVRFSIDDDGAITTLATTSAQSVPELACGSTQTTSTYFTRWTPTKEGAYTLIAEIDPADGVAESDESNNHATTVIRVREKPFAATNLQVVAPMRDQTTTKFDDTLSFAEARARAWVFADSMEHCDSFKCWPWEWEDTARTRVTTGWTFEVDGPDGRSTEADVTLPVEFAGYFDSLAQEIGATDWSIEIHAGIFEGSSLSSFRTDSDYIRREKLVDKSKPPPWDLSLGNVVFGVGYDIASRGLDRAVGKVQIIAKPAVNVGHALEFVRLLLVIGGLFTADAVVADSVDVVLEDVPLEQGKSYTAFVSLKLYTAAVGLTTYQLADFMNRQPHTVPSLRDDMPARGVWMERPVVSFK